MYERSAIVLERYFNEIFGFDKKINLKTIYKDYKELIEETKKYQMILEEENEIINEFDETANEIRRIQQEQKKIFKNIIKFEEERNKLFDSLDEEPSIVDKKMRKIEDNIKESNQKLEELRECFIESLTKFIEKQKERNRCSRSRRTEERTHLDIIERADKNLKDIDIESLKSIKNYINTDDSIIKKEIIEIMINNGKDERVPFDEQVIENAVNVRNELAKKEAECYILIYERMRRLLIDANNDEVKLDKYNKALRDVSVKLAFLKAQEMYIVSFLDNERMTVINGVKVHKQLMSDACERFESDMEQFSNLYELILKETSGKSTKKAYKELYNKEYLKNIEEKERNFEEEVNGIKIKAGTIINSNYWRIEEIKNIYEVFQKEVSEKFEKDLSEFRLESPEEIDYIDDRDEEIRNNIFKLQIDDDIEEFEEDEENQDNQYEYEEDDDDDSKNDNDYEYEVEDDSKHDEEDDEYSEDEDDYEDNEEFEYEYDDDEYDEYEEDYDDDEYEEDYDEDEYEEDYEYDEYDEYDEEEDDDEYYNNNKQKCPKDKIDSQRMENKRDIKTKEHLGNNKRGIFNKLFKDKKD